MTSINEKIKNLPEDVSEFLDSVWAANVNLDILNRNGLSLDKANILLDLISAIFVKEISLEELPEKLSNSLNIDRNLANKISCDIAGMRLCNIEKWLGVNINSYISSLGGDINNYKDYPNQEVKKITEEKKYLLEQTKPDSDFVFIPKKNNIENYEQEVDIDKEKKDAPDVFRKHVLDIIFNYESVDIIEEYNDILSLALEDEKFRTELVIALQNNNEKISDGQLIIDNKEQQSTIGNWLTDFIKTEGSDIFDDLKIVEYLNLSKNSKNLQEKDKFILRKIFKLYKNIAFFPDSLAGVPRDDWQIIPVNSQSDDIILKKERNSNIKEPIESNKNKLSDELVKKDFINYENQKIKDLRAILLSYPVSSLEYKALVQEINRLEKLEKNR